MIDLDNAPRWLALAHGEMGQAEIPGPDANPHIIGYFRDIGRDDVTSDETPSCAAFAGAMLKRAGLPHSGSALARSYETYGRAGELVPGAIVVVATGADRKGRHVGFLAWRANGRVYLLGSNQHDTVNVSGFLETSVTAVRWPAENIARQNNPESKATTGAATGSKPVAAQVPAPLFDVLARSRTVFAVILGWLGMLLQHVETGVRLAIEWATSIGDLAPLRTVGEQVGANTRAIGIGLTSYALVRVLHRYVADKQAGVR